MKLLLELVDNNLLLVHCVSEKVLVEVQLFDFVSHVIVFNRKFSDLISIYRRVKVANNYLCAIKNLLGFQVHVLAWLIEVLGLEIAVMLWISFTTARNLFQ